MELRERGHAASWGMPKMAPKVEREWQNQLDVMEKKNHGEHRKIRLKNDGKLLRIIWKNDRKYFKK